MLDIPFDGQGGPPPRCTNPIRMQMLRTDANSEARFKLN